VIISLVLGALVLLAMIGVSWYGWVTLPADALVPVHFGAGYKNFVPKRYGLVIHPAAGALVYVLLGLTGRAASSGGRSAVSLASVILPIVMCLVLAVQAGAIRVARRRVGGPSRAAGGAPGPGTQPTGSNL
jgi:hypothetical protein